MDHRVDRAEEFGNPVGGNQAGEEKGVTQAQAFNLSHQPIAQNAIADEHEADVGIGLEDGGSGFEDVIVPLAFEEAGDGPEGYIVVLES
jgi:hypothetical protein